MINKRNIVLILLLTFLMLPQNAFAADITYGYYGTTTTTASNPLYANSSNGDASHWIDLSVSGSGHGYVVWGMNDGTGHLVEMNRSAVPADAVQPPGTGAIAFWLESSDGGEIHATIGHTNNDNNLTVYFTDSNGGGSGGGGTGTGCDACQMFSCPGWAEYMQKLQDIQNSIPPAPNWQTVADTFRDTIEPKMISDLSSLLGSVDDPPSIPGAPSIPDLPSDLDTRGITEPTGQEDPGLGSSTFSEDDIKNNASVIQERQDPTGGFSILDPIAGLPSQDEFKQNKPNEGTADLPANPNEGDNVAPNPPDSDNYSPPNPKDDGNIAPKPTNDGSGTAPMPGGTSGDFDTPPIPGDAGGTAPLPSESGTAPIPSDNMDTPPIP
jgi:hypothetical protein